VFSKETKTFDKSLRRLICVKILTNSQRVSRDFNLLIKKLRDFCVKPYTLKLLDVRQEYIITADISEISLL
jgi:hypothetical protein